MGRLLRKLDHTGLLPVPSKSAPGTSPRLRDCIPLRQFVQEALLSFIIGLHGRVNRAQLWSQKTGSSPNFPSLHTVTPPF